MFSRGHADPADAQWGQNWGMNGYFYIARGQNECNVESRGEFALPEL